MTHVSSEFLRRVVKYFPFKINTIQTDNGFKFTPKENGRVERSHRKDQERFYYNKVFCSLEDLEIEKSIVKNGFLW